MWNTNLLQEWLPLLGQPQSDACEASPLPKFQTLTPMCRRFHQRWQTKCEAHQGADLRHQRCHPLKENLPNMHFEKPLLEILLLSNHSSQKCIENKNYEEVKFRRKFHLISLHFSGMWILS